MPIEMTERLERALEEWAGSRMKLGFEELGWQTKELIAAYREARDAAKTKPGWEAIARAALDYVLNDRLEDGDLTELDRLCQEYWDAQQPIPAPKKWPEAHKCPGWPCEICSALNIEAYRNAPSEKEGEEVGFFHPNCKPDEDGLWSDCPKCAAERGWASITESHETPLTVERLVRVLRGMQSSAYSPGTMQKLADALEGKEE